MEFECTVADEVAFLLLFFVVNVVSAMEVVYVMSLEVYVLKEYEVEKETSLIPVEEEPDADAEPEAEEESETPVEEEGNHQMCEVVTSPLDKVTVSVVNGSSHARDVPVEEAADMSEDWVVPEVLDNVVVVFVLSLS